MSVKINTELTDEEFANLHYVLGDFHRITRDGYYRFVKTDYTYSEDKTNKTRYQIAENLLKKLVEDNKK